MCRIVLSDDDTLEGARLLSAVIGMIMEDHADPAVSTLPASGDDRRQHFERLGRAGQDIMALATAAEVLLRLGKGGCSCS
jgi:hypothetical protein